MKKIKVGVVGYGTIGKRVADAVKLQKDMELVGVTGHSYNFRIKVANLNNIPVYVLGDDSDFVKNKIKPAGEIDDLVKKVDVIVDCTPKSVGMENKEKYYKPQGVKAIFQGGEKADIADCSFVAQVNYDDAVGKNFVRVVSCNTTGLSRTLHSLHKKFGIKKARAVLIRRATDPGDSKKGPINAIVPTLSLPSHHGPDVQTVLPVNIVSTAVIVPTTIMHMHVVSAELKKKADVDEVIELWKNTTRVRIVSAEEKIESTAQIMELARDLGNKRSDMMDICVWKEGIGIHDGELFYMQAVHQESDVVPENIDAVRAVMGFKDKEKSINMTNKSLGIK